jgi:uncharacterized protein with GYD domain
MNWTDHGVKNSKDSVRRAKEAEGLIAPFGARFQSIHWTVGQYDIVIVMEAADEESATAALLALGSQGNARTTTMRAFSAEEMGRIVSKLG